MIPKSFPGQNIIFAENQPEYQNLPALCLPGSEAEVITCWQFTPDELEVINKTGCMYISQLRFTNIFGVPNKLQPILPMAELGDNIGLTV